jgi:ribosomal protein S18 acetylase RimI-like enzyme
MKNGIIIKYGLTKEDLRDIGNLNDICNDVESLNMKLNWDMLETRPDNIGDDYFYFIEDKVVGYLGMYGIEKTEIEITGMVHPDFRGKGVFTEMFKAARAECVKRGIEKILLISERRILSGSSFAKALDSKYSFSEYRMERENHFAEGSLKHGILLRAAKEEDCELLARIDVAAFGAKEEQGAEEAEAEEVSRKKKNWQSSFIGEYQGTGIGKLRIVNEDGNIGIYGFGVLKELRGRGYGREILSLAIQEILKQSPKKITLEVACENERALNLYKSCGFEVTTIYDYYEIMLG